MKREKKKIFFRLSFEKSLWSIFRQTTNILENKRAKNIQKLNIHNTQLTAPQLNGMQKDVVICSLCIFSPFQFVWIVCPPLCVFRNCARQLDETMSVPFPVVHHISFCCCFFFSPFQFNFGNFLGSIAINLSVTQSVSITFYLVCHARFTVPWRCWRMHLSGSHNVLETRRNHFQRNIDLILQKC